MSADGELPGMWEESDLSGGWADTDGMSVREGILDLIAKILPPGHAKAYRELFDRKLDAFAHELAEKQRGFASATAAAFGECCESTALAAAALIDPEAPKDAPPGT